MKQKIKVIDHTTNKGKKTPEGKEFVIESEMRSYDHFEAQRKFKANVFKPKKGKGSYSRKNRVNLNKKEDL